MSTSSGRLTGLGTPAKYCTGRTQAYRSSRWRSATLMLRMPPPTGVVSGPLMAMMILVDGLQRLLRQPDRLAVDLVGLLAGIDFHPGDLALAAIGLFHRCVEHRLARRPDVDAGAVALDKADDGVIRYVKLAVLQLDFFAGLGHNDLLIRHLELSLVMVQQ